MSEFIRKQVERGVFFSKITDKRYKTNQIVIHLFTDYDEIPRGDYAVAAYLLTESCRKFPRYNLLSRHLSNLYNASLTSVTGMGQWDKRCTTIRANILDNRYALDGENLEAEMCGLIRECILNPNAENDEFDAAETELMRTELIDTIDSVINDKASYAAVNACKTAFRGEPQELPANGTHEQAEKVTSKSAYAAYKKILETAHIEILCVGSSDFSTAENLLTKLFAGITRNNICELSVSPSPLKDTPERVSDKLPMMQQAILRIYFKAPELSDKFANDMLLTILGGMTTSRFFTNIREKQSLCYYCAAAGRFNKRFMTAYAGVEPQNIERTEQAILKEIADIAENGVSDAELQAALMDFRNQLQSLYDKASLLGIWYLNQILEERIFTPEEYMNELSKVSSERIQAAARLYKTDTVYTLSGEEAE